MEIDTQGALNVMKRCPDGLFIFLLRWVCPIILLLVFLDNLGLY